MGRRTDPRALRGVALALLAAGCLATAACGDDGEPATAGAPAALSTATADSSIPSTDATSSLPPVDSTTPDEGVSTVDSGAGATATTPVDASGPRLEGSWRLVFRAVTVKGRYKVIKPGSEAAWRYSFVPACDTGPCDAVATLTVDGEPPRTVRYRYTGSSWVARTKYSWGSLKCKGKVVQDAIAATQQVTLTFKGDELVGTFSNNDNTRPALADDGCVWQGRIRGTVTADRR